MDPRRFFVPSYMMMPYNINPRSPGLFSRLFNGIKSTNWSNILNNANKTLNVVNQTIPLVKQAGPMFNNMRSMFSLAKAFGNETTKKTNKQPEKPIKKETSELPNFFVN